MRELHPIVSQGMLTHALYWFPALDLGMDDSMSTLLTDSVVFLFTDAISYVDAASRVANPIAMLWYARLALQPHQAAISTDH